MSLSELNWGNPQIKENEVTASAAMIQLKTSG